MSGDLANMAIGQGDLLATPLQVAQAMAGIANGLEVPKARLVKQIQDLNGNVVEQFPYQARNALNLNPNDLKAVRQGMVNVVHSARGTGKRGANGYYNVAAKTGTAQWNAGKNLAWFAGFVPAGNPEYAFACVYEGVKGEGGISGGGKAAPMAASFFARHYRYRKEAGNAPDAFVNYALKSGDDTDDPEPVKKSTSKKKTRSASKPEPNTLPAVKPETSAANARETTKKQSGLQKFWNRVRGR
jgi:membrane peptidoglycan carboxypeptidase